MLSWFQKLMPREERFFDLFTEHSRYLTAGAEALRDLLHSEPGGIAGAIRTVTAREADADRVTREVLILVRRTFITPFDRGDIRSLIAAMDDAIDEMQQTAKSIDLFGVTAFEPEMQRIGEAIVRSAALVAEAIPLLAEISREAARIAAIAEQLSQIEGQADETYDLGLKSLFQRHVGPDAMPFVIGSTIYEQLEGVVDRFDDIGNQLNSIVIEHV